MSSTSTFQKIINSTKYDLHHKTPWPDPETSIGDQVFSDGRYTYWLGTGPAREYYTTLWKKIRDLLSIQEDYLNSGISVFRPLMINLYMIGSRPAVATPTIVFICELKKVRRRAITLVKEGEILSGFPGFKLAEAATPPGIKRPMRLFAGDGVPVADGNVVMSGAIADMNFPDNGGVEHGVSHGQQLLQKVAYCSEEYDRSVGIPIFVGEKSREVAALRQATMGGIISYEGKAFGVTVAHSFSATPVGLEAYESEPEDLDFEFSFDDDSIDEIEETEEKGKETAVDDGEVTGQVKISLNFPAVDIVDNSLKDYAPKPPVPPSNGDLSFPRHLKGNKDSDKLIEIGPLYMSSDEVQGNPLDWALIEITREHFKTLDKVFLDQAFPLELLSGEDGLVEHVVSQNNDLNIAVIAITGGGKNLRGFMMKTPTIMNVTSRNFFEEMWPVRLNGNMENGDCGTWVLDAYSGQMYGHIVAGHPGSNIYYMISASSVFGDIVRRLKGIKPESYTRLDNGALIEEVNEGREKRKLERIDKEKVLLETIQKNESGRNQAIPSAVEEAITKLPIPSVKGQIKGPVKPAPQKDDIEEVKKREKAMAEVQAESEERRKAVNDVQAQLEQSKKEIAKLHAILVEDRKRIYEHRTQIDAENKLVNEIRSRLDSHNRPIPIVPIAELPSDSDPNKTKKTRFIHFKDAVGRKFQFPFHLVTTWMDMEELIKQAFLHVDVIGPHVAEGHYDLISRGEIILPQVWETIIEPDMSISMHMWPLPEPDRPAPLHPGANPFVPLGRAGPPHPGRPRGYPAGPQPGPMPPIRPIPAPRPPEIETIEIPGPATSKRKDGDSRQTGVGQHRSKQSVQPHLSGRTAVERSPVASDSGGMEELVVIRRRKSLWKNNRIVRSLAGRLSGRRGRVGGSESSGSFVDD